MKVSLVTAVVLMVLPSCDKTADPPITNPDIRDIAGRPDEAQKWDRVFPIKINVFRDGGTLEIVTIDDSGGEKSVYYIFTQPSHRKAELRLEKAGWC